MKASERLATYLCDERHIYKGSHAMRRRAALADFQAALAAARREERERCIAICNTAWNEFADLNDTWSAAQCAAITSLIRALDPADEEGGGEEKNG